MKLFFYRYSKAIIIGCYCIVSLVFFSAVPVSAETPPTPSCTIDTPTPTPGGQASYTCSCPSPWIYINDDPYNNPSSASCVAGVACTLNSGDSGVVTGTECCVQGTTNCSQLSTCNNQQGVVVGDLCCSNSPKSLSDCVSLLGKVTSPSTAINSIGDAFILARNVLLGLVATIAGIVLLYGGFLWMSSQGEPEQIKKAQSIILYTAVGVAVIALSVIIIRVVSTVLGINISNLLG